MATVADVIRPSSEEESIAIQPNCVLINEVTVCEDAAVDPNFAAFSFGPYAIVHIVTINLLFWLLVEKNLL